MQAMNYQGGKGVNYPLLGLCGLGAPFHIYQIITQKGTLGDLTRVRRQLADRTHELHLHSHVRLCPYHLLLCSPHMLSSASP